MENNKNKKSVKFQGDMLNFYDFIQVFIFTTNHHLNYVYHKMLVNENESYTVLVVERSIMCSNIRLVTIFR